MSNIQFSLFPNQATIHFIRTAGAMLELPVRTTATAIIYYHQFNRFMLMNKGKASMRNNHIVDEMLPLNTCEELLAMTCLLLACKATDVSRKVRDIVNVGYRYYHPKQEPLQIDETYFQMRGSLVTGELLLVRALGYNLEVALPFTFCLHVLRAMAAVSWFVNYAKDDPNEHHQQQAPYTHLVRSGSPDFQRDVWRHMEQEMSPELSTIARLAWAFCWDSISSPKIILTRNPTEIALGCLYLALRTCQAELPMTINQWVDTWGTSENLSVQNIRDVVTDLLDLFAGQSDRTPLPSENKTQDQQQRPQSTPALT
ncbi:cyclin-like protein [Dichotomocladium elegans]|nr:cyclin-like protein [Dichotomocladium elegans]